MIYDLRHVTTYRYGTPVTFAQCTLRTLPGTGPGQVVIGSSLAIDPEPAALTEHLSFFGNRVAVAQIDEEHSVLRIEARAAVAVEREVPPDVPGAPWETVRDVAYASTSLDPGSPAQFVYPSLLVRLAEPVTGYAAESFGPGRPIYEAARELMARIRKDFRYDPDATRVSTPLLEAFENRHGVCQDFAHIMIAGLRGLGLSAAYVSGYIRTVPPPGKQRLEGGDASHAWTALWCGVDLGWIGLDPTNDLVVRDDHIVLGNGRDYADVAPVGGRLQGAGEQEIEVEVDVVPRLSQTTEKSR